MLITRRLILGILCLPGPRGQDIGLLLLRPGLYVLRSLVRKPAHLVQILPSWRHCRPTSRSWAAWLDASKERREAAE